MVIINNKIGGGEIIRLIENLFGTYKGDFGFAKGEIYIGELNNNIHAEVSYNSIGIMHERAQIKNITEEYIELILDLNEFLSFNGLTKLYNLSDKIQWFITQNYVGFLSTSKNKIIFRLCNNIPSAKRYLKYPLNPFNSNPASFYNIPTEFDIMSIDPLHVHIAEGTFDIVSIERNLFHDKDKNRNLFFASCGFGPMAIVQYLVYFGAGGNIVLHIYCDNDKTDFEQIKIMKNRREMFPWVKEIWFHRNKIHPYEKDYGVPLDRIKDEKRKVIIK